MTRKLRRQMAEQGLTEADIRSLVAEGSLIPKAQPVNLWYLAEAVRDIAGELTAKDLEIERLKKRTP